MADPVAEAKVGVVELGHLVLYVRDLQRSAEFYGDVLGWEKVAGPHPDVPGAMFSGGRTHHELFLIEVGPDAQPIPQGRRVGMYHFGLKVGDHDDELRTMLARVQARPDLCTVVGASDHTMTHSLYLLDPDGNELELYVDVPGVDLTDPAVLLAPIKPLHL